MIHGVVRSITNADSGKTLSRAVPGMVVDVVFANKSKNVDAPIEFGFFVLSEARAKQVVEQRCVHRPSHGGRNDAKYVYV